MLSVTWLNLGGDRVLPDEFATQRFNWPVGVCTFGAGLGGRFAPLSNMHELPLRLGDVVVASSETAYQAAKFAAHPHGQAHTLALRGRQAKTYARRNAVLGQAWDARRRRAMLAALVLKLDQHASVVDCLADTSGRPIVEVSRHDSYWGALPSDIGFTGINLLGRMLMFLRDVWLEQAPVLRSWVDQEAPRLWPAAHPASGKGCLRAAGGEVAG